MSERMCRFDPGSGYEDSLVIVWLWGFLILAGCTKGVLFRERLQRKVKNTAKFCVGLQGLWTQKWRGKFTRTCPLAKEQSDRFGKKSTFATFLHQRPFDIPLFSTSSLLIKKSLNYDCSSCGCCIFAVQSFRVKDWYVASLIKCAESGRIRTKSNYSTSVRRLKFWVVMAYVSFYYTNSVKVLKHNKSF